MRFLLLFTLAGAFLCPAQSDDAAWQRMLASKQTVTDYLVRRARHVTDQAAAELKDRTTWEPVRARRLEEMRDMLGLLPWPQRTPLNFRIAGTLDKGSYIIEKIVFESVPKFYVTGNLYIPKGARRAPAVIYVCGHAGTPYGAKTQYQRHGISFAKNGYVAFILDPIQIAETFALHHGVYNEEMHDWYSRGYTPAGIETWNAMRAIDYLETRPEVDAARIGMTGRSGGAAMSWFAASVDPRIKVVSPIMGISTYAANVAANTQKGHCDCMFPINSYLHDMLHQGALIAPRPLLVGEGIQDALFPVAGYKEFQQCVSGLYNSYSRGDEFRLVEVDTGHLDSDYLREQVLLWFDRHLMRTPDRKLDMSYTNEAPESLTVFSGHPPADARNGHVHEFWNARRPASADLLQQLRTKVFHAVPNPPGNAQLRKTGKSDGGWQEVEITSTETVPVRGLLRPAAGDAAIVYIASDAEDTASITALFSGLQVPGNVTRLVVFPRGVGEVPWPRTFYRDTLRNAMHVGETVDSMRLADTLAAVAALRAARVTVFGKGTSAALGLYAAILNPAIEHVVMIDPPATHANAPIFLNILRYTDLPEAAALIAPRRLTFYARIPAPYTPRFKAVTRIAWTQ